MNLRGCFQTKLLLYVISKPIAQSYNMQHCYIHTYTHIHLQLQTTVLHFARPRAIPLISVSGIFPGKPKNNLFLH